MAVDYSCFGLQDRAAVVAGASQGIRRAIALGVAQAGEHVILANTRKAVAKRSARYELKSRASTKRPLLGRFRTSPAFTP
ncbi:MAG TPA: hypothetical protein VG345_13610, partial [Bryobacteraceae bacterium]|nr:hypothetical protein [Bryobacteraceae bacterium]